MSPKETPHTLATQIIQKNLKEMRQHSKNREGLSQAEVNSKALEALLARALCATCARFSVSETKNIGCSYSANSPSEMAQKLVNGAYSHELTCDGHVPIKPEFNVFTDVEGVTRYNYLATDLGPED
jgi:hypothetical protein